MKEMSVSRNGQLWLRHSTKLGARRVSPVRSLTPNFTIVALKMWAIGAEIAKIGIFWYKFAKKGYIPLIDFYKIWRGGSDSQARNLFQI